MKAVFFDVDGVLNSEKFVCSGEGGYINPKNLSNLKAIVDATEAKLVLTSDWRSEALKENSTKPQVTELREQLAGAGLALYGVTRSGSELQDKYNDYTRACAVKDYVDTNGVEGYAILDDMDLDWERVGIADHWINTDNIIRGLTENDAKSAVAVING